MASKSNALETAYLNLLFKNTDFATVGDATGLRGSTTAGSLYIGLYTADPGETGDQTTTEVAYTGYARVAVTRGAGFTVTGNSVALAADVTFPASSSAGSTAGYWGIGTAASPGAGVLLYSAAISPTIACTSGVTPKLTAGALAIED